MSEKRSNVAICAPGELYGGVEQFVCTFAAYLHKETRFAPLVILFNEGEHLKRLKDLSLDFVVVKPRWKYDFLVIRRLSTLFNSRKIDIVHTHGYKATIIGSLAAKSCGLPVIKTEHGLIEPRKKFDPKRFRMRLNLLADKIVTKSFIDHVVYVTKGLRASFDEKGRKNGNSVIYNAIPPISPTAAAPPPEIDPHSFNLGIVGRLGEVKGHRFLFSAIKELHDLPDLKLNVLGEGPLRESLVEFCAQNDLTDRISFVGFKKNIYDYISAFDILLIPSLYEGLPYTLLETMFLNVPIIASNVGGLKEILEDRQDALLVEPQNPKAIAEAIRRLHGDEVERMRIAENAYRKVSDSFMISDMVKAYVKLFHMLLPESSSQTTSSKVKTT